MSIFAFRAGLMPEFPSPPPGAPETSDVITEEAGVRPPSGPSLRVRALVSEDQVVAKGAPVACMHDAPDIQFIAPMAGRIARISLLPGHRLSEIVLFREAGDEIDGHHTSAAATEDGLRRLMQKSGIWPWLRRRPFGGMPAAGERPAAIVVMAIDTRPHAPEPIHAIAERAEAVERGLAALTLLTAGPVFVCQPPGPRLFERGLGGGRLKSVDCGPRHPQGSAGIRIHDLAPATIDAPVWDIHAEDVAALGDLLMTGILPTTRQVSVTGSAMRESRLVRTQQGADLRELTQRFVMPGCPRPDVGIAARRAPGTLAWSPRPAGDRPASAGRGTTPALARLRPDTVSPSGPRRSHGSHAAGFRSRGARRIPGACAEFRR